MRNLHLGLYTPNQGVPKHSGSLFHSTRATTEKKKILEEEFGVAMNEELEAIKAAGDTPYIVGHMEAGEKGVTLC